SAVGSLAKIVPSWSIKNIAPPELSAPYFCQILFCLSNSTNVSQGHFSRSKILTKLFVFLNSPATPITTKPLSLYSLYTGSMALLFVMHGPHQVAHRSNKATFPFILSDNLTILPFKSGAEKSV